MNDIKLDDLNKTAKTHIHKAIKNLSKAREQLKFGILDDIFKTQRIKIAILIDEIDDTITKMDS